MHRPVQSKILGPSSADPGRFAYSCAVVDLQDLTASTLAEQGASEAEALQTTCSMVARIYRIDQKKVGRLLDCY